MIKLRDCKELSQEAGLSTSQELGREAPPLEKILVLSVTQWALPGSEHLPSGWR